MYAVMQKVVDDIKTAPGRKTAVGPPLGPTGVIQPTSAVKDVPQHGRADRSQSAPKKQSWGSFHKWQQPWL